MLDIVGYWSAVTVVCAFLLYPWVFIGVIISEWYITRITDGEKGGGILNYVGENLTWCEQPILECIIGVVGLVVSVVISIHVGTGSLTYIKTIHNSASFFTPFFTTVTPILIGLFLMDKIIKKCYTYSKLLKKLEKENK